MWLGRRCFAHIRKRLDGRNRRRIRQYLGVGYNFRLWHHFDIRYCHNIGRYVRLGYYHPCIRHHKSLGYDFCIRDYHSVWIYPCNRYHHCFRRNFCIRHHIHNRYTANRGRYLRVGNQPCIGCDLSVRHRSCNGYDHRIRHNFCLGLYFGDRYLLSIQHDVNIECTRYDHYVCERCSTAVGSGHIRAYDQRHFSCAGCRYFDLVADTVRDPTDGPADVACTPAAGMPCGPNTVL